VFLHICKHSPLSPGTEDLAHTLYTYTVQVTDCSLVDLTLDFGLAHNILVVNGVNNVVRETVEPYTSKLVAVVRAYEVEWKAECAIRVVKKAPKEEVQRGLIGQERWQEVAQAWKGRRTGAESVEEVR